jgi:hypothetical protein
VSRFERFAGVGQIVVAGGGDLVAAVIELLVSRWSRATGCAGGQRSTLVSRLRRPF